MDGYVAEGGSRAPLSQVLARFQAAAGAAWAGSGLGAGPSPLPVSATFSVGVVGSLLTMVSVADRGPVATGPKRTLIRHACGAGRVALVHVSRLIRKSSMSPLATRTLEIFNGAVPVFDTVITNGGLSVETCWPLKS